MSVSDSITQLQDNLWADLRTRRHFPEVCPKLAHYTSVEVLEKIMSTDEVWMSHPLLMNDVEELKWGMRTGAQEFRESEALKSACGSAECFEQLVSQFSEAFSSYDSTHVIDTFVLSFSVQEEENWDGRLSMWRGYGAGGKGAAIVFDTAKIQHIDGSPLLLMEVTYLSTEDRVKEIQAMIQVVADALAASRKSPADLHIAALAFLERLKVFALFTKHTGFDEEHEWRLVYRSEHDVEKLLRPMIGYAMTARGVEPKLRLKIRDLPRPFMQYRGIEDVLDRVLLGPSHSNLLAQVCIQKMLHANGKSILCDRVFASGIPFRP